MAIDAWTAGLLFLGGLAGSLHCVGMCGVFPVSLAAGTRERPLLRQALYNLGRLNTLVAIGALSGALGAALVQAAPVRGAERLLALAAGALMLVVGLELLGLLRQVTGRLAAHVQKLVSELLSGVIRSRSWGAPLALGVFNAFLPCQLIYAFAARAAGTGSAWQGMLTMFCFGLGTIPAMLALGSVRGWLPLALRSRLTTASGVLVIVFALITILRAFHLPAHH